MNSITELLDILDNFFQKGPQGLSTYDDESINRHFEKLSQSKDEKLNQPFINHIKQLELTKLEDLTLENLDLSKFRNFGRNVIKTNKENLESIFYLSEMFEKNVYEKINPILKTLPKSYPTQFRNVAKWLLSTQGNLTDYTNETESIMVIHDELMTLEKVIKNIKISDVCLAPDKIISKINKLDSNEYRLFFKDWALKFSSLIESRFKSIIVFMNYFWRLEKKQRAPLSKLKKKMLGSLFKDMNIEQNYQNIDRIRVYRNQTFHSKIKFNYDENWEKCSIMLKEDLSVTATEFILDFAKVFRFLNTFMVNITLIGITMT